jgi:membrane protease YdiL (CAAX protease family)
VDALAPVGPLARALVIGVGAGAGSGFALWLIRGLPPLETLQRFQQRLLRDWTVTDALAVSLLSGLAEEALLRALLQPIIGLVPAAVVFSVLHFVPDRRLWAWPVIALLLGLVLGLVFEIAGFPAAAAAHVVINLVAMLRLRGYEAP